MRKASGMDQRRNSVDSSLTQAKNGAYQSRARTKIAEIESAATLMAVTA